MDKKYTPILTRGEIFIKHGRHGNPHPRMIWTDKELKYIFWNSPKTKTPKKKSSYLISDILDVIEGRKTPVFNKMSIFGSGDESNEHLCFSLQFATRTLDLQANNYDTQRLWVKIFKWILNTKANPMKVKAYRDQTISAPSNFRHVAHVDREFQWKGNLMDSITLVKKLGQGSFGTVWLDFLGVQKGTKFPIAIKTFNNIDEESLRDITNEIEALKTCRHTNIVSYYGIYQPPGDDASLWLLMDFCGAGTISDLVMRMETSLSEIQLSFLLSCVLKALVYLHGKRIVHRDIKGANIMVTEDGLIKLADFGLSATCDVTHAPGNDVTSIAGSPLWMAPEVLKGQKPSFSSDIWSLGITAIELADREIPYADLPFHALVRKITRPEIPPPNLNPNTIWSSDFRDFITRCLVRNPQQRPTAKLLLQHPFITKGIGQTTKILLNFIKRAMSAPEPVYQASSAPMEEDELDAGSFILAPARQKKEEPTPQSDSEWSEETENEDGEEISTVQHRNKSESADRLIPDEFKEFNLNSSIRSVIIVEDRDDMNEESVNIIADSIGGSKDKPHVRSLASSLFKKFEEQVVTPPSVMKPLTQTHEDIDFSKPISQIEEKKQPISLKDSNIQPKPETKQVEPKPETKQAEPKPETKKVEPKPETKKVEPKPETKKVEPKPETKKVEPKPETKKVEPKPETKKVEPKTQKVEKKTEPKKIVQKTQPNNPLSHIKQFKSNEANQKLVSEKIEAKEEKREPILFVISPSDNPIKGRIVHTGNCPSCNNTLIPSERKKCEYLGVFVCKSCFRNQQTFIPSKILKDIDFKLYKVCSESYQLLNDAIKTKYINVKSIQPRLNILSNKYFEQACYLRLRLSLMQGFILTCPQRDEWQVKLNSCNFSIDRHVDEYTLDDLYLIIKGDLISKMKSLIQSIEKHIVNECVICNGRGFICEYCHSDEIIYPFLSSDKVSVCEGCMACFHSKEYTPESCPKCIRIRNREMKKKNMRKKTAEYLTKSESLYH